MKYTALVLAILLSAAEAAASEQPYDIHVHLRSLWSASRNKWPINSPATLGSVVFLTACVGLKKIRDRCIKNMRTKDNIINLMQPYVYFALFSSLDKAKNCMIGSSNGNHETSGDSGIMRLLDKMFPWKKAKTVRDMPKIESQRKNFLNGIWES